MDSVTESLKLTVKYDRPLFCELLSLCGLACSKAAYIINPAFTFLRPEYYVEYE